MVLLMPSGRSSDILILQDHLDKSLNNINQENLLDKVDREMTDPLANANEITLTIPEFRVAGDIDANQVLKKVIRFFISDNGTKLGEYKKAHCISILLS